MRISRDDRDGDRRGDWLESYEFAQACQIWSVAKTEADCAGRFAELKTLIRTRLLNVAPPGETDYARNRRMNEEFGK